MDRPLTGPAFVSSADRQWENVLPCLVLLEGGHHGVSPALTIDILVLPYVFFLSECISSSLVSRTQRKLQDRAGPRPRE
jgi:hypothetical protein